MTKDVWDFTILLYRMKAIDRNFWYIFNDYYDWKMQGDLVCRSDFFIGIQNNPQHKRFFDE